MGFEKVTKLEDKVASFFGAPYAIATDSCTHAVELCLRYEQPYEVTFPTHTYPSIPFLGSKLAKTPFCETHLIFFLFISKNSCCFLANSYASLGSV